MGAATAALFSGAALAQGVPVYNWSGFYVGGNAGYGWGDDEIELGYSGVIAAVCAAVPGSCPDSVPRDTEGFLAGGHIGRNWQSGRFVFGIEGDAAWSDIGGEATATAPLGFGSGRFDLDWLSTIRGRAGIAADRVHLYGTGGLAFGQVDNSATATVDVGIGAPILVTVVDREKAVQFGFAAGVGGEFALSDRMVVGAEALYVNLEDSSLTFDFGAAGAVGAAIENDYLIARVRGSYKW
jgi:outer membrane immunogenic protein